MKKVLAVLLAVLLVIAACPLAFAAESDSVKLSATKTNITADNVLNNDGYGSVKIEGKLAGSEKVDPRPQSALIDKTGKMLFPYRETYNRFYYSDGVVSLAATNPYSIADDTLLTQDADWEINHKVYPIFYNLDGTELFNLEYSETAIDSGFISYSYLSTSISEGLAVVLKCRSETNVFPSTYSLYVVDKTGKTVFELPEGFVTIIAAGAGGVNMKNSLGSFSEGLAAFFESSRNGWDVSSKALGYMDGTGKTVIDLSGEHYQNAGSFSDGMAWVGNGQELGFIDKTGKEVIPCQYEAAYPFQDGLAAVKKDGKWGFIDKDNHMVVPFTYADAFSGEDGVLSACKGDKYGLIDRDNNVLVPFEYDDISAFLNGVAYAVKDRTLYIITPEGEAPAPSVPSFTDVPAGQFYTDAVAWAVENGITKGTSATTFGPGQSCTRGQIVTFLWNAAGKPEPKSAANPFVDIKSSDYFYKPVLWAVENKITSGTDSTHFTPGKPCTRAEAMTFMWRAEGSPSGAASSSFTDVAADSYYAKAVNWAVEEKITSGTSAATFSPNQTCTRGQIVTFLYRNK